MYFDIDDIVYDVIVERKKNKNLYIRVTDDIKLKVTCPYLYTNKMILNILNENKKSIKKMINKKIVRYENDSYSSNCLLGEKINVVYDDVKKPLFTEKRLIIKDDVMLDKWYRLIAKNVFKKSLDDVYYMFDEKIPYPKLKIRSMKTRWGVCNKKDNSITLNLELIKKNHKYLNYVIIHELSHFVHFNHSKAFWNTVEKYCPEYKLVRKELKE